MGQQFEEVYAEKKNTYQIFYDKNYCLPTESDREVALSEVHRILVLNGILTDLDTIGFNSLSHS